jgi:hypothetical protein
MEKGNSSLNFKDWSKSFSYSIKENDGENSFFWVDDITIKDSEYIMGTDPIPMLKDYTLNNEEDDCI